MRWQPHVTVAAVIERDGGYLLVEEHINGKNVLNQPAGHWEKDESLIDAVRREVLEETAWKFDPEFLIGVYRWDQPNAGKTFLRFAFAGKAWGHDPTLPLDHGIIRAAWISLDEIRHRTSQHRSPQVQRAIDDYLSGRRFPLDFIVDV